MYKKAKSRTNTKSSTIEETIHLENKLPFNPKEKTGPTTDLFYHELKTEKGVAQRIIKYLVGLVLASLFLVTFPFVAVAIKLSAGDTVIHKNKVPGKRGFTFQRYSYSTISSKTNSPFLLGTILRKTGLAKLPSVINIWNGEMNLIGPYPYPDEWSNTWNQQLSDYYKRFAIKPGYIAVASPAKDLKNLKKVEQSLRKELKYVANPSLKRDVKHLFQIS
jgi:lipopolysaccharide/colanic/teichoic acid biosynthesis glycosyltransferase